MVRSSRIDIERFNGNNFEIWNLKMEDIITDREKWTTIYLATQPTRM
jgi:hypothetical protein